MDRVPTRRTAANAASSATRRSHRKSRNGCRQCKQRHVKCDEQRPTCVNCSTASQRCSYLDQLPSARPTSSPAISSQSEPSTTPPVATAFSLASPAAAIAAAGESGDGSTHPMPDRQAPFIFNLNHLALLHHLETASRELGPAFLAPDEKDARPFVEMVFKAAISAPYLMDQVLAFSALHLSTLQSDSAAKAEYHHQASELQTRALKSFNSDLPEVRDETCMAMFLFTSLLGIHILFDTAVSRRDVTEFLDKFIQYLGIHRGVRAITSESWHVIRHTEMKLILDPIEAADGLQPHAGDECDRLMRLLTSLSGDGPASALSKTCLEAVQSLRWVLSRHHNLTMPYRTHVVLAWPVLLSAEYVDLLRQRRPEALVILAHWAVLLHRDRDFWAFGDVGRFLIESITGYLGAYWDEMLAWPKEALDLV